MKAEMTSLISGLSGMTYNSSTPKQRCSTAYPKDLTQSNVKRLTCARASTSRVLDGRLDLHTAAAAATAAVVGISFKKASRSQSSNITCTWIFARKSCEQRLSFTRTGTVTPSFCIELFVLGPCFRGSFHSRQLLCARPGLNSPRFLLQLLNTIF
jgi:hypothetical protein